MPRPPSGARQVSSSSAASSAAAAAANGHGLSHSGARRIRPSSAAPTVFSAQHPQHASSSSFSSQQQQLQHSARSVGKSPVGNINQRRRMSAGGELLRAHSYTPDAYGGGGGSGSLHEGRSSSAGRGGGGGDLIHIHDVDDAGMMGGEHSRRALAMARHAAAAIESKGLDAIAVQDRLAATAKALKKCEDERNGFRNKCARLEAVIRKKDREIDEVLVKGAQAAAGDAAVCADGGVVGWLGERVWWSSSWKMIVWGSHLFGSLNWVFFSYAILSLL